METVVPHNAALNGQLPTAAPTVLQPSNSPMKEAAVKTPAEDDTQAAGATPLQRRPITGKARKTPDAAGKPGKEMSPGEKPSRTSPGEGSGGLAFMQRKMKQFVSIKPVKQSAAHDDPSTALKNTGPAPAAPPAPSWNSFVPCNEIDAPGNGEGNAANVQQQPPTSMSNCKPQPGLSTWQKAPARGIPSPAPLKFYTNIADKQKEKSVVPVLGEGQDGLECGSATKVPAPFSRFAFGASSALCTPLAPRFGLAPGSADRSVNPMPKAMISGYGTKTMSAGHGLAGAGPLAGEGAVASTAGTQDAMRKRVKMRGGGMSWLAAKFQAASAAAAQVPQAPSPSGGEGSGPLDMSAALGFL